MTLTDNGDGTADLTGTPTAADLAGSNDVKIRINDNSFDVYREFSVSEAAAPPDADGDGTPDASDAFPNNASETTDTDNDGIGNNANTDDDGDSVLDVNDAFPLNIDKSIATDGIESGDAPSPTAATKSDDGLFGIGSNGPTFLLFLLGLAHLLRRKEQ